MAHGQTGRDATRMYPVVLVAVLLVTGALSGLAVTGRLSPSPSPPRSRPSPFTVAPAENQPPAPAAVLRALMRTRAEAVQASATTPNIVRAAGTHLALNGEPWRFVGFDDYKLTSTADPGAYTCGGAQPDTAVDADFAAMRALGVSVVRTWFFQSYVASGNWRPFDRVLADAARYGIRVIPVLTNEWGSCENLNNATAQYKDLNWYQGGYRTERDYGLPLPYRAYAAEVARRYAGNPTIAFWQLVNEAEAAPYLHAPCDEGQSAQALRGFADDMATLLKTVDPAHLVSLGTIGGAQCGMTDGYYQYINAGAIDVCEYHDYQAPLSAPLVNPCAAIDKPYFAGERGFPADMSSGAVTSTTLQARAAAFAADMQEAFAVDGCQGYLIWSWSDGASASFDIGAGDPTRLVVQQAATQYGSTHAVLVYVAQQAGAAA